MPNWCNCDLMIEGNENKIQDLFSFVKGDIPESNEEISLFDFNKIIPMPSSLMISSPPQEKDMIIAKENLEKYGYTDWYDWCKANWGTKWPASDILISKEKINNIYKITFNTAWSPPFPIIEKLGQMYPDLLFIFHYFEPNMLFAGRFIVQNENISDEYFNYKDDMKHVEEIGRNIFGMNKFFTQIRMENSNGSET